MPTPPFDIDGLSRPARDLLPEWMAERAAQIAEARAKANEGQ